MQMTGHGAKFGRKRQQALAALLENGTVKEAGKAAGVSDSTLSRWMREPTFKSEYQAARRQVVEAAIAKVQGLAGQAITVLQGVMLDQGNPASSRVQAAKNIIELSLRGIEDGDILVRLDALELALLQRR